MKKKGEKKLQKTGTVISKVSSITFRNMEIIMTDHKASAWAYSGAV